MDLQKTAEHFNKLLKKVPNTAAREAYRSEFVDLGQQLSDPNLAAGQRPILEARVLQLIRSVEVASNVKFWSLGTMLFSTFVIVIFFAAIVLYMLGLEGDISSVRATRPILVFTLIVAMLGFGGLLIVRALYGAEEEEHLDRRFRLAREVFLVYAGIFGTIIGFYFGAADEAEVAAPPAVALAVNERTMTAQVTGGSVPFVAYLSREDPELDLLMEGSDRLLTLELGAGTCPVGATVTVVDGLGRRASADVLPANVKNSPEPNCGPPTNGSGNPIAPLQAPAAPDINTSTPEGTLNSL